MGALTFAEQEVEPEEDEVVWHRNILRGEMSMRKDEAGLDAHCNHPKGGIEAAIWLASNTNTVDDE